MLDAQIWAIEPRNSAQGMTYTLPVVQPIFWDAATKVTMAKPNTPNAVGSDIMILVSLGAGVTSVGEVLGMGCFRCLVMGFSSVPAADGAFRPGSARAPRW